MLFKKAIIIEAWPVLDGMVDSRIEQSGWMIVYLLLISNITITYDVMLHSNSMLSSITSHPSNSQPLSNWSQDVEMDAVKQQHQTAIVLKSKYIFYDTVV